MRTKPCLEYVSLNIGGVMQTNKPNKGVFYNWNFLGIFLLLITLSACSATPYKPGDKLAANEGLALIRVYARYDGEKHFSGGAVKLGLIKSGAMCCMQWVAPDENDDYKLLRLEAGKYEIARFGLGEHFLFFEPRWVFDIKPRTIIYLGDFNVWIDTNLVYLYSRYKYFDKSNEAKEKVYQDYSLNSRDFDFESIAGSKPESQNFIFQYSVMQWSPTRIDADGRIAYFGLRR